MGKIYEVKWTILAAEEFEYSVDWLIKHWNENIAIQFVDAVESKIAMLKKFPSLGNPSSAIPGCRKTLVLPYHILLYKREGETIEIIRLFDGRQDPEKIYTEGLQE
jgi:plasmid stabilization system protein ParE